MYILLTLFYLTFVILLSQVLTYNVTLINVRSAFYSIFWIFFMIYVLITIFTLSKKSNLNIIGNYLEIIKYILIASLIGTFLIIVRDIVLFNELNTASYLKILFSFLIVSITISLIYFLNISFYKYRIIWIIGFIGTILISSLLVESEIFLRDLRLKSFLNFWNLIVPYKSIEQIRQFVIFEGWQGWELFLISTIHLLIYWFVLISICLYFRQFQSKWQFE